MGIVNRRNAVLGWAAWQVGKRAAMMKAKAAVPGRADESRRPNKGAVVSALAAVGGAIWFWRRRRGGKSGEDAPAKPARSRPRRRQGGAGGK